MKRLILALALAPAALLAACGGTACSSSPATPQNTGGTSCTVAAGQTITVNVSLCGKCTDSSPSCQAEFVGSELQVAPAVQQCQEQAGCNIAAGCDFPPPVASCTVAVPTGTPSGTPIVITGNQNYQGTLDTGGAATICNL